MNGIDSCFTKSWRREIKTFLSFYVRWFVCGIGFEQ